MADLQEIIKTHTKSYPSYLDTYPRNGKTTVPSSRLTKRVLTADSHLNRDKIEFNLSVPRIKGCHENALDKSFETSPHLICLYASTNIHLGPA